MNSDLVSVRMVVITAALPDHELWRKGAAMAALPVDFLAHTPGSAAVAVTKGGADVCVLDGDVPEEELTAVIAAGKALKPQPLVFVYSANALPPREGIDGMLKRPSNLDEARRLVEICTRKKYPSRVLSVDDSSTMRAIVRKILAASRFALDIHDVSEGNAALKQLRNGKFDLVFLDYNMPGLNGFEMLLEIRRKTPIISVVMMTSQVDEAIAERARTAGALDFLKKPFYPAEIDQVLERYYGMNEPVG